MRNHSRTWITLNLSYHLQLHIFLTMKQSSPIVKRQPFEQNLFAAFYETLPLFHSSTNFFQYRFSKAEGFPSRWLWSWKWHKSILFKPVNESLRFHALSWLLNYLSCVNPFKVCNSIEISITFLLDKSLKKNAICKFSKVTPLCTRQVLAVSMQRKVNNFDKEQICWKDWY